MLRIRLRLAPERRISLSVAEVAIIGVARVMNGEDIKPVFMGRPARNRHYTKRKLPRWRENLGEVGMF